MTLDQLCFKKNKKEKKKGLVTLREKDTIIQGGYIQKLITW